MRVCVLCLLSLSVVSVCVRVCARVCVLFVRAHTQGSLGEQEQQDRDSISSVHSSQELLEEQQMHGMQVYI